MPAIPNHLRVVSSTARTVTLGDGQDRFKVTVAGLRRAEHLVAAADADPSPEGYERWCRVALAVR